MKPVDYSKTSRYGEAMAMDRAIRSNTSDPMKERPPAEIEAQFYDEGMNRSLQLGYMGLQKEQFEAGMAENKRQFDVSTAEKGRQFKMNLDFTRDQMKYQRRQDNRAELVGMMNVGLGIGFGFLQYKQNRKQIEMNKIMMGILKDRQ
jgi:hypothetical protein